jgi:hypothetical protein
MAQRHISDAGGNWNATTAWEEGVVPVAGDDIRATATSGDLKVNVHTAHLRSFDLDGYTGTLSRSWGNINIAGEANQTVILRFDGTITFNGSVVLYNSPENAIVEVYWGGVTTVDDFYLYGSHTVNQRSDITIAGTLGIFAEDAHFKTNGFTINAESIAANINQERTFNFKDSTLNVTDDFNMYDTAGTLTIDSDGSTINCEGNFTSGDKTYNIVNLTGDGDALLWGHGGTTTINTLTRTGGASSSANSLRLWNTALTVTGTLTLTGNNALANRLLVYNNVTGTQATITADTVVASNVDFMDIKGAGDADWDLSAITGGSGDCGGNSDITFTTSTEQHWTNADGGDWSDSGNWTSRVPLPQDDCTFDCAFNTSKTITIDSGAPIRSGRNTDWSGATFTTALTWATIANSKYGNLTLKTGMTVSGTGVVNLMGRGSQTITSNGVTVTHPLYFYGSYAFQDAFSSSSTLYLYKGTLDGNNQNITATLFNSQTNTYARTLIMGSGTWTITGAWSCWHLVTTNLTYTKGGTLIISNTDSAPKTMYGGSQDYATVTISGNNVLIRDNNSLDTLNVNTAGHATGLKLLRNTTQTIGTLTTNGSSGNLAKMASDTTTAATVSKSGGGRVSVDYMHLTRVAAVQTLTWYAGTNSTDGGNNTNWIFGDPPVAKGVSDSGAGSEVIDAKMISFSFTLQDSGLGSDIASAQMTEKFLVLHDTSIGIDTASSEIIGKYILLQELGSGVDIIQLLNSLSIPDIGSSADIIQLLNSLSIPDIGSGVDLATSDFVGKIVVVSDTSLGVDNIGDLLNALLVSDTALGVDAVSSPLNSLQVLDGGLGADLVKDLLNNLQISDTALGVDAIQELLNTLLVSDIVSGVDGVNTIPLVFKLVQDSTSGVDVASAEMIAYGFLISDVASGVDSIDAKMISYSFTLNDVGSGVDSIDAKMISYSFTLHDLGVGVDVLSSLINTLEILDIGSGIDSLIPALNSLLISETSSGSDLILDLLNSLLVSDSGLGVDVASAEMIGNIIILHDSGSGVDIASAEMVGKVIVIQDLGSGVDVASAEMVGKVIVIPDVGGSSDTLYIYSSVLIQELGLSQEDVFAFVDALVIDSNLLAVEDLFIGNKCMVTDSAGYSELLSVLSRNILQDSGLSQEQISAFIKASVIDTNITTVEDLFIRNKFMLTDSGSIKLLDDIHGMHTTHQYTGNNPEIDGPKTIDGNKDTFLGSNHGRSSGSSCTSEHDFGEEINLKRLVFKAHAYSAVHGIDSYGGSISTSVTVEYWNSSTSLWVSIPELSKSNSGSVSGGSHSKQVSIDDVAEVDIYTAKIRATASSSNSINGGQGSGDGYNQIFLIEAYGSPSEIVSVVARTILQDSGLSNDDAVVVSASVLLHDSSLGNELLNVLITLLESDNGLFNDELPKIHTHTYITDSGIGIEYITLRTALSIEDYAYLDQETVVVFTTVTIPENVLSLEELSLRKFQILIFLSSKFPERTKILQSNFD